jgi:hypothetical protein
MVTLTVRFEHDWAQAAQLQPLCHDGFGNAKPGSNSGNVNSAVNQIAERLELVGRVHGHPHDVLGKADFTGIGINRHKLARYVQISSDRALFGKQSQRQQAPLPGDDGELAAFHLSGRWAPAEARVPQSMRPALRCRRKRRFYGHCRSTR